LLGVYSAHRFFVGGKTRALEITEALTPSPVHAVNVSPAYLFRKVGDEQSGRPTILYDEVDTLFGSKVQDGGEIRGLLNAGHRRGAVAGRCVVVGNKVQTEEIPAYCAVALAGIGNLPDTIASRAVIIEMRRRAPDEVVEPFRRRLHFPEGESLRTILARWCAEIVGGMENLEPEMPLGVNDRDADCWEPLVAIADAAGSDWPERARASAVNLVTAASDRTMTTGVQLLSDLHDLFGEADRIGTEVILQRLHNLPESPWADIYGKPLNDRGLATRLRKYGVKPKVIRIGEGTHRGYLAEDLREQWRRYLSVPEKCVTSETSETRTNGETAERPESRETAASVTDVTDVTLNLGWQPDVTDNNPFTALRDCKWALQLEGDKDREKMQMHRARLHPKWKKGAIATLCCSTVGSLSRTVDTARALVATGLTGKLTICDGKSGRPRSIIPDIEKAAGFRVSEEGRDGLRLRRIVDPDIASPADEMGFGCCDDAEGARRGCLSCPNIQNVAHVLPSGSFCPVTLRKNCS
jgi:Protein of unknown function (DUF3631)